MNLSAISTVSAVLILGAALDVSAQRNKTNCGPDVKVSVTIAGSLSEPAGNALVSDGLGAYVNASKGANKITAIFQVENCTHDFTMNLNFATRSMWALLTDSENNPLTRRGNFFNFDRVHSVPETTAPGFSSSQICTNGWARNADGTVPKNPDGTYRDNYGGCGTDEFGNHFVRRGGGVSLDPDERLSFVRSPLDQAIACPNPEEPLCATDYIRVYHPDANTWVLRPEGAAQASYRVWVSGAYLFVGHRPVPFEITVTRAQ